jgi:hypothetical protein
VVHPRILWNVRRLERDADHHSESQEGSERDRHLPSVFLQYVFLSTGSYCCYKEHEAQIKIRTGAFSIYITLVCQCENASTSFLLD